MATTQMNPQQQNAIGRMNLLATGVQMTKRLQPQTGIAMGSQVRIPLLRMGIMTGITLLFTVPVDVVSGGPTASPFFPHNIVQGVKYTDFAGVDRTKTNGWQLWAANSLKDNELRGSSAYAAGWGNHNSNILSQAVPASNSNIVFSLYIPCAYDPTSDLTGAVLTQTNVGEHYVTLQLANALVGTDPWAFPFQGGAVPLDAAGVTVEAFQHYIQPQNMDLRMLPLLDLSTNYGYEGAFQSSAGIAAGQSKYIDYPNNRAILGALMTFENGSAVTANETDVSLVTLLANSNTNFRELTPRLIRQMMREILNGADLPNGCYYLGSRRQPIMTQQYANVQAKFDVASVAGANVTQFITQFEVQYASGSPLPGISMS